MNLTAEILTPLHNTSEIPFADRIGHLKASCLSDALALTPQPDWSK
jgi:hypothetical protein